MDELPDLVLCKILQQLDLIDKLRCRRVCKRFLLLIDNLPSKELIIQTDFEFQAQRWFDNFRATNPRNFLCVWSGSAKLFQTNLLASRYFANLKKLYFDIDGYSFEDREPFHFSFCFLNDFTQLKTLLIYLSGSKHYFSYDCREPIVLKNLANLYLDFSGIEEDLLQLDCENLNYLELELPLFNRVQLASKHVKHIRTTSSSSFKESVESLRTFKCVQEFDCRVSDLSDISALISLIDEYKELKILSVQAVQRYKQTFNVEAIEQLRRHLETVRPDVELYLNGLLSKNFDKLMPFPQNGCLESNLEFYLQNHQSTSKLLREFRFLAYDRWEPLELRGQIPRGFLQKLVDLCSITVKGKVNDPNCLAQLLCKCELIETLRLINSSLHQTFYSNLSRYVPHLTRLEIEDDPALLESLDFNFLSEFNNLCSFNLKHPLNLDLAYRFFMGSITAQLFDFIINDRPEFLTREGSEDRENDLTEVDNENWKAWASKLAEDYNKKYGGLEVWINWFELPIRFLFFYRDV